MNASLPIPFAIGETVWHASGDRRRVEEPCPDCAGTLKHEVHLGCGEVVKVWCQGCAARWLDYDEIAREGRPGVEERWVVEPKVEQVVLASVEVRGAEVTYYSERLGGSAHIYYAADLFRTEAEALARAQEKSAKQNAHDDENFANTRKSKWSKKNAAEKAAWLAGYWKREAKRHDEEAAKARERMARCQAKAGGAK